MTPPPPARRRLAGWSVVGVFALLGAALFATVWATRSSVKDASLAVGRGQAIAMEQAVRADLANLDGPPTQAELEAILADNAPDGLRYLATVEARRLAPMLSAGTPVGDGPAEQIGVGRRLRETNNRIRLEVRAIRRMKTGLGRPGRFVIEIEPTQAAELRTSATRTLLIGGLGAVMLLGTAIVVIRLEAKRRAGEAKREHERRLASLGEMSAVLAHEIKNPLASLKGNAQLLTSMLASDTPRIDKAKAKAERVVDEAVRLEKLTQDLLAFVRTGAIHREPIDPAALAREVAGDNAEVTVDATGAPAKWSLDPARIREVLVNLVDNALVAGPPVVVRVARRDRSCLFEVEDRGPGVPESERENIFGAFVTTKTHGTGLGLAVVRRVVELHGGTVTVDVGRGSAEAPGAIFRVEIPEA